MFFKKFKDFIFDIKVAWSLMIIFILSFFIYIVVGSVKKDNDDSKKGEENKQTSSKKKSFFHFGPDENTYFFTIKLDTWNKVLLIYFFCFIISFMNYYYSSIMDFTIYSTVWNPAYKDPMKISKFSTYIFLLTDPIIWWFYRIIEFYVLILGQFQYLVPGLLGILISKWPYSILRINEKIYK